MDFLVVKSKYKNKKTPILFLHGWGGDKNSFYFLRNCFKDRDLWFISFPGHGRTPQPTSVIGVPEIGEELIKFIKNNNLNKIDLVAHSFGGRIALYLLGNYPALFRKAVLVGCAGLKPRFNLKVKFKILFFKIKKFLVKCKIVGLNSLDKKGSLDYINLSPIMKQCFNKIIHKDLSCYAKKIKTPTILVWGKEDKATPLYMGKKLCKLIKNSKLIVMNNCSHFCFYEESLRFALILQYFFV